MRIHTNIASMAAGRQLGQTRRRLGESYNKLSSGSRITRAGDDAASLAISEKLKGKMRAEVAMGRSANDAISYFQYAEGATNSISDNLVRMRELAIQAASDTIDQTQRSFINKEILQLRKEIDRVSEVTKIGDYKLLSGETKEFEVMLSDNAKAVNFDLKDLAHDTHSLGVYDIDFMNARQARLGLEKLDFAINEVSGSRAKMGAFHARLESAANNLAISHEGTSAANSRMRDSDYANETAINLKEKLKEQMGVKALASSNLSHQVALKLIG